jgi:hypothetical protein
VKAPRLPAVLDSTTYVDEGRWAAPEIYFRWSIGLVER